MPSTTLNPNILESDRSSALIGEVLPRSAVDVPLTDRLFELFAQFYLQVDRARFEQDQLEKDWIILLRDPPGVVHGFTTLKLYEIELLGRKIRALFSGNTIIDPKYWGEQELVATWCRFMAQIKRQAPTVPLYWFLICSGYRTYLYLPLFFQEFFPCPEREPPEFERALLDTLGRMKFPGEYRDGIVHVNPPRECLRPELARPRLAKTKNTHVRFFFERNPGYLKGDELVCITEFSLTNTKRLAHKTAQEVLGC